MLGPHIDVPQKWPGVLFAILFFKVGANRNWELTETAVLFKTGTYSKGRLINKNSADLLCEMKMKIIINGEGRHGFP